MPTRWLTWKVVRALFEAIAPGEVEVLRLDPAVHHPAFPWFDKPAGRQLFDSSSPRHVTARHLCLEFPKFGSDFHVAYKLYAFARENELNWFSAAVLSPVFKRHGTALYEWWHGNAKYVLPPTRSTEYMRIRTEHEQAARCEEVVRHAAADWAAIHADWAVVRIPDLMDHQSDEYQAYRTRGRQEYEAQERREYERLKAKFEKASD